MRKTTLSTSRLPSVLLALLATLGLLAGCASSPAAGTAPGFRTLPQPTTAVAPAPAPDVAALPPEAAIPLTPELRSGELANGLRYFVRRNTEPAGRAELRLVVDAGSILEEEDQRGLAHFLEHMLFNGTERFPGQDLVVFLEGTGMQVGPEVNAYTTFDETVYQLKIPTDRQGILPTALDVLEDWSAAALLTPEEIDAERGVITEEWRLRDLSAGGRIREKTLPLYLAGSRYLERLPIGTPEVIQGAPPERIERFYRTWYRPDNLSVIAVGDFDPARVEAMIRERFSDLKNPDEPEPRRRYDVPGHPETLYEVVTDPEQPVTVVRLGWKRPAPEEGTIGSYKEYLEAQLFDQMLNLRLFEASQQEGSALLQASAGRDLLVRSLELFGISALAPEGRSPEALEAILTEVERVRRHGFTAAELERAKSDTVTTYRRAAAEQANTSSAALADELVRHVTTDEPVPGILAERALVERFIPEITLEDLNREAAKLGAADRVVLVLAPEKTDAAAPAEEALTRVVARVEAAEIAPYEDTLGDRELMAELPAPAEIVERREVAELGVTELVLENGARVVYKQTTLREQEVLFSATSPGGASLVDDEDYPEAALAGLVTLQSGVNGLSLADLLKLLAGTNVTVAPRIDDLFEGMDGQARSADLETLFQLVHLFFTAPGQDLTAFTRVQGEFISRLENLQSVPEAVLQDAVSEALYGDTVRAGLLPVEEIRQLDAERLFAIYRDRFADASDFTFVFVGSFEPAELEELAKRYLGTLPSTRRQETYRDRLPAPPATVVTRTVTKGQEERSQVRLVFEGSLPEITADTYLTATMLQKLLGQNLQSTLREEMGAVYGVLTEIGLTEVPTPGYRATVEFTTDPQRVDELVEAVFDEIDALLDAGPDAGGISNSGMATAKEQERRKRQEALGRNGFWLGILGRWAEMPSYDPREVLTFDDRLAAISPKAVRDLGETILSEERYVRVVLMPEGAAGAPAVPAAP
jgi:zinc protease